MFLEEYFKRIFGEDDREDEQRRGRKNLPRLGFLEEPPSPLHSGVFFTLSWGYLKGEVVVYSEDWGVWMLLPTVLYGASSKSNSAVLRKRRRLFWFLFLRRLLSAAQSGRRRTLPAGLERKGTIHLAFYGDRLELEWEQIPTWMRSD